MIAIVTHTGDEHQTLLPNILARHCVLPVVEATDGLAIQAGRVMVASPGHHLMTRYRCRTGHVFTELSLAMEQDVAVESSLWAALRGLEEGADLALQMSQRASFQGTPRAGEAHLRHHELTEHARNLRAVLERL